MSALTLKLATQLATQALTAGRTISAAPLTIAVLDSGGHLVTLQREDGASLLRPQIAIGKAWAPLPWARVHVCWRWTPNSARRLSRR